MEEKKKKFWKDKKNIAIIALSFIVICCIGANVQNTTQRSISTTNHEVTVANAGNNNLEEKITKQEEEIKSLKEKCVELEGKNNIANQNYSKLEDENKELKQENDKLKDNNEKLSSEIEKLKKNVSATKSTETYSSSSDSSDISNSQTVYITKTGKKYHRAGCSYLRKSKIAIDLKSAKASGYTACSRCY